MSVTAVLTSRAGEPVSLVGVPLGETHTSLTLMTRVVRVIRAGTGMAGTPSRTMAMPLGKEGTRETRRAARASDASPVLVLAAAPQDVTVAPVAAARGACVGDARASGLAVPWLWRIGNASSYRRARARSARSSCHTGNHV
ncbi:MAG: hypothetical protein ACLP1X_21665 [Polyangiaceae bacterium]